MLGLSARVACSLSDCDRVPILAESSQASCKRVTFSLFRYVHMHCIVISMYVCVYAERRVLPKLQNTLMVPDSVMSFWRRIHDRFLSR